MAFWKIEVYLHTSDKTPIKTGYCNADSQTEAEELAHRAIGDNEKADLGVVKASNVAAFPVGQVLWI